MAPPRTRVWSGTITFGLVAVPVAVVPAVHASRSAFHLIHKKDASRLKRMMYCPEENTFVPNEEIRRGFEIEEGKHILVSDEEIDSISPKHSKTIEIQEFVERGSVDPAFYDRPYYLIPTGPEKPYRLLVEVMADTGRLGIAEFVMHARENLCAIASIDGALCLATLRYANALRASSDVVPDAASDKKDVDAMLKAINGMKKKFDPNNMKDKYQERIKKLIARKKKQGETVEVHEIDDDERMAADDGEQKGEIIDLVSALEASLAREKKRAS